MKKTKQKESPEAAPAPKGGFRQSDRAEIPESALTFREHKVLTALRLAKRSLSVRELGRMCFPGMRAKPGTYETTSADGKAVRNAAGAAYRCVLNSLRRLVVGGFVAKAERGRYVAVTERAVDTSPAEAAPSREPDTEEISHE